MVDDEGVRLAYWFAGLGALVAVAGAALGIIGAVDASRRETRAWEAVGHSRNLWILVQLVAILFPPLPLAVSFIYFKILRPRLKHGRSAVS